MSAPNIACLEEELRRTRNSRKRCGILMKMSESLFLVEPRRALALADEAAGLAESTGDKEVMALAYAGQGECHRQIEEFTMALEKLKKAAALMDELPDNPVRKIPTYINIGATHCAIGEYAQALEWFERALVLSVGGKQRDRAVALGSIGMVYRDIGDYPKALELFGETLKVMQQIDDAQGIGVTYNNMASVYANIDDYNTALELYAKCTELHRRAGYRGGEASALCNIGSVHTRLKNPSAAREYLQRAIDIYTEIGRMQSAARGLRDLGQIHLDAGSYDLALECACRTLEVIDGGDPNALEYAEALQLIGSVYFQVGDYVAALGYFTQTELIAESIGHATLQCEIQRLLAEVHEQLGNSAPAIRHMKRHAELRVRLAGEGAHRSAMVLQARIRIEQSEKEREIYRLKSEQLQREMEHKSAELATLAMQIVQNNEFIAHFKEEVKGLTKEYGCDARLTAALIHRLQSNRHAGESWQTFEQQFQYVHSGFLTTLSQRCPTLTPTELKICSFLKMGLSNKQIGSLLSISDRTVDTHRTSIRRKLGLNGGNNLTAFLVAL